MANYQVSIEDIRIFAFHGLYPEERILGNWYTLDVIVESETQPNFSDDIANTIDYSQIYAICKQIMAIPVDLLETVAEKIAQKIRDDISEEVSILVQISKENPPMGLSSGRSTVVYRLD
ncbi:MAG: Dihydroneopterin aldolase [Bacteroidota bacterium]|jgi:dihydroneopterin aldolase|uniref:7,8-dihydroneopterin aldolase n=1 Tax=Aquirufa novilacunae TaxID=3139305 RepID=A0ABW8TY53_9BACT